MQVLFCVGVLVTVLNMSNCPGSSSRMPCGSTSRAILWSFSFAGFVVRSPGIRRQESTFVIAFMVCEDIPSFYGKKCDVLASSWQRDENLSIGIENHCDELARARQQDWTDIQSLWIVEHGIRVIFEFQHQQMLINGSEHSPLSRAWLPTPHYETQWVAWVKRGNARILL
jgi:hypothetical protein